MGCVMKRMRLGLLFALDALLAETREVEGQLLHDTFDPPLMEGQKCHEACGYMGSTPMQES